MGNMHARDFHAFILAAGEGRRLRPYTDHLPKPLVPVIGRPILAHALDHLIVAGVSNITVNCFHKAEKIKEFLREYKGQASIHLSEEEALLNTGLGVKRGLGHMGGKAFYVINGDAFWSDGAGGSVFERLSHQWAADDMDILLLLQPVADMELTEGVGDYDLDENGRAIRRKDQSGAYMFAGVRICKPDIFDDSPDVPFSFLELMDAAEEKGRLYGLVHDGDWHHISTPNDLERVNAALVKKEHVA